MSHGEDGKTEIDALNVDSKQVRVLGILLTEGPQAGQPRLPNLAGVQNQDASCWGLLLHLENTSGTHPLPHQLNPYFETQGSPARGQYGRLTELRALKALDF